MLLCKLPNPVRGSYCSYLKERLAGMATSLPSTSACLPPRQAFGRLRPPLLQSSVDLYLQYVKQLVPQEQWSRTVEVAERFAHPGGEGEELQRLLEQKAESEDNWLFNWWLSGYLGYRAPVVVHSNPAIRLPILKFANDGEWLNFAGSFIHGFLKYKAMLEAGRLPVDKMFDGSPLCMTQHYAVIGNCRIPDLPEDRLLFKTGARFNAIKARHICVFFKNQPYRVDVLDPTTSQPLDAQTIAAQLRRIVEQGASVTAEPVGLYTTLPRDEWAPIFKGLKQSQMNCNTLHQIISSICLLCLDSSPVLPSASTENSTSGNLFLSARDTANACNGLHGFGKGFDNSANRWHDKTIQFIVSRDGCTSLNFEHAPADGHAIISILESAWKHSQGDLSIQQTLTRTQQKALLPPLCLEWELPSSAQDSLERSREQLDSLADNVQLQLGSFTGFGKEKLKALKVSPDSFIQLGIQLAYSRLHPDRLPPATYESGSMRAFYLGRTETIRSCSQQSTTFTKAMDDGSIDHKRKRELLRAAVDAHRNYINLAVGGRAFDRHLFGLKQIASSQGMPIPSLFADPTYSTAVHFRVSSSQISSSIDLCTSYAPVVPDGYGFCYNVQSNALQLMTSSLKSDPSTQPPAKLMQAFAAALDDMYSLLEVSGP